MDGYEVKVWREGNRIRKADGTGYGDQVSDHDITQHVRSSLTDGDYDHVAFAGALLWLREKERSVRG